MRENNTPSQPADSYLKRKKALQKTRGMWKNNPEAEQEMRDIRSEFD